MKANLTTRSLAVLATLLYRRAKKSTRIAEWSWNAAMAFLFIAGTSESVTLVVVAIMLLVAATNHRNRVEGEY